MRAKNLAKLVPPAFVRLSTDLDKLFFKRLVSIRRNLERKPEIFQKIFFVGFGGKFEKLVPRSMLSGE